MVSDQSVIGLIVTFGLAQIGIYLDQRRRAGTTDTKIDGATVAAKLAAKRSEPTANGFADDVREGLATVIEKQTGILEEVGKLRDQFYSHLGDHASSDLHRKQ